MKARENTMTRFLKFTLLEKPLSMIAFVFLIAGIFFVAVLPYRNTKDS